MLRWAEHMADFNSIDDIRSGPQIEKDTLALFDEIQRSIPKGSGNLTRCAAEVADEISTPGC